MVGHEEVLAAVAEVAGEPISVDGAVRWLRGRGSPPLAACLRAAARGRNAVAHPHRFLLGDIRAFAEGRAQYQGDGSSRSGFRMVPCAIAASARGTFPQKVGSHVKGHIFKVVKKSEALEKTGKPPITTEWVDTDKTHGTGKATVRSTWVARDFKGMNAKDQEDLFSATPPIELMR